jgi:hypothetical protein
VTANSVPKFCEGSPLSERVRKITDSSSTNTFRFILGRQEETQMKSRAFDGAGNLVEMQEDEQFGMMLSVHPLSPFLSRRQK